MTLYKADVTQPYVFYPVETRKGERQWRVDYKKQILSRIKYFNKIGKNLSQKALMKWMISRNTNSVNRKETVEKRVLEAIADLFTDDCLIDVRGEYWYSVEDRNNEVKYPPSVYPVEFAIAQAILNYTLSIANREPTAKNPYVKTRWVGKPALIKYISRMRRDFDPNLVETVIDDMIIKNVLITRDPYFLAIDPIKQSLRDMKYVQQKMREAVSRRVASHK